MNYLIVYDKRETSFTGLGLAVLEKAYNVKIRQQINGEYLLSFNLPRNNEKWQYIQVENKVKAEGQIFRIKKISDGRDEAGKLIGEVSCEHITYDLNDNVFIPYFERIGATPTDILSVALTNTGFSIGTVDQSLPKTDIEMSKANPMKIIAKLIENIGGELIRDNFTISIVKRIGSDKGVQFRIGKNIGDIKRDIDSTGLVTELWPLGKDGMQIDSVNNGVAYLRSNLYDPQNPKRGFMDFDIEDPAELKDEGLRQFSTADRDGIDKPKTSYQANVLELKKLKEYGDYEAFCLGDSIRLFDSYLGIDTKQRIIEYEYYPFEAQKSTVGLANYDLKLYRERSIGNTIASLIINKNAVENVMTSSGGLNAQYLDNIRERLQTDINGIVQKALLHTQADLYVDDIYNPQKALILGPGLFAIANNKRTNGDWNWRTIANGDRVVADEVDAKWVYAGTVSADQIKSGTIEGITIKGTTITGGTINGTIINGGTVNGVNMVGGKFQNTSGTGWMTIDQAGGNIADFNFWVDTAPGVPLFTIYNGLSGIGLQVLGTSFLGSNGANTYPDGLWNCSNATFSGLWNGSCWYATQDWVSANFVHK